MGRALFKSAPHGEYTLRSGMQWHARVVLPNVPLQVFGRQLDKKITAIVPVRATGTVRFDESALEDPAEQAYAKARRPSYLVFEHDRRFIWGPVTAVDGVHRFQMRPGPPGDYTLSPRGRRVMKRLTGAND